MQLEIGLFFVYKHKTKKKESRAIFERETYTTSFNYIGSPLYFFLHGAACLFLSTSARFHLRSRPALPSVLALFLQFPVVRRLYSKAIRIGRNRLSPPSTNEDVLFTLHPRSFSTSIVFFLKINQFAHVPCIQLNNNYNPLIVIRPSSP